VIVAAVLLVLALISLVAASSVPPRLEVLPVRLAAPAIIRRPTRPAVVLVHGILGFETLGFGPLRVDYFRRVVGPLGAAGHDVVVARVPALGSVPARAAALAQTIAALPHDRVTVIAHSMGGLDARWAIAHGAAARVDALVTIGTPHLGTPIADLLARGIPAEALAWLTTRRLAGFAREAPDVAGVRYACMIAATHQRARVHPLLRASHAYLSRVAGRNDGLVPASSQAWGEILSDHDLDHWAQVGWSGGHDAAAMLLAALGHLLPVRGSLAA
jgi:triacylglycerol lipase